MDVHDETVQRLAAQIRTFHSTKSPFRIYHGSTNSTRPSTHTTSNTINTSTLNRVLSINAATQTCLVEPNVPMDALVNSLLPHGLMPPVVMEFPGITVGGAFAGTGGESSSFRHGFFDRCVLSIEIITGDGNVLRCDENENQDLFHGAASSFGTLGVTTLLELRLVRARKYVRMRYVPVGGIEEAVEVVKRESKEGEGVVDYIDGIMYAKDRGVVCVGRLSDTIDNGIKVMRFTRRSDPWFYQHVDQLLKSGTASQVVEEAIPLYDYLFRYDRSAFYLAPHAFRYFLTPLNSLTRYILDPLLHTRPMYTALHASNLSSKYIIQDVAIPLQHTSNFIEYLDMTFGQYPLWLCPILRTGDGRGTHTLKLQSSQKSQSSHSNDNAEDKEDEEYLMLNIGIWGPCPKPPSTSLPFPLTLTHASPTEFLLFNRSLEKKVHSLGGQKWLYAHTYYTSAEFESIYDTRSYDALRRKYGCEYLPSVFEKVRVDFEGEKRRRVEEWRALVREGGVKGWVTWGWRWVWGKWPLQGLWGVWWAVRGREYVLKSEEKGRVAVGDQKKGE